MKFYTEFHAVKFQKPTERKF